MHDIFITGANGVFGRATIAQLVTRKVSVLALVSNPDSAASIEALGATALAGDLRDRKTVRRGIAQAPILYHIAPAYMHDEIAVGKAILADAKRARLAHVVLQGVSYPYVRSVDFHWAKAVMEEALAESGLPFTVIRPVQLMQNLEWSLGKILASGQYGLPYAPERRISSSLSVSGSGS